MKLNNKFTLISVALMTGAACLTACSSDEVARIRDSARTAKA